MFLSLPILEARGAVFKLCLQEEGGGGQKKLTFCKLLYIENVNGGGWVVKKRQVLKT